MAAELAALRRVPADASALGSVTLDFVLPLERLALATLLDARGLAALEPFLHSWYPMPTSLADRLWNALLARKLLSVEVLPLFQERMKLNLSRYSRFVPGRTEANLQTLDDELVQQLGSFHNAVEVRLNGCDGVTDAGVAAFAAHPRLAVVDLDGTRLGDAGFAALASCARIARLSVRRTMITNASGASLATMLHLQHLNLDNTRIGDEFLQHLASLPALTRLSLVQASAVSSVGIACLSQLRSLRALNLEGTQVQDNDLDHIVQLSHLVSLSLARTSVTDDGVLRLSALTDLASLDLSYTSITHSCLSYLKALPHLRFLGLLDVYVPFQMDELQQFLQRAGAPRIAISRGDSVSVEEQLECLGHFSAPLSEACQRSIASTTAFLHRLCYNVSNTAFSSPTVVQAGGVEVALAVLEAYPNNREIMVLTTSMLNQMLVLDAACERSLPHGCIERLLQVLRAFCVNSDIARNVVGALCKLLTFSVTSRSHRGARVLFIERGGVEATLAVIRTLALLEQPTTMQARDLLEICLRLLCLGVFGSPFNVRSRALVIAVESFATLGGQVMMLAPSLGLLARLACYPVHHDAMRAARVPEILVQLLNSAHVMTLPEEALADLISVLAHLSASDEGTRHLVSSHGLMGVSSLLQSILSSAGQQQNQHQLQHQHQQMVAAAGAQQQQQPIPRSVIALVNLLWSLSVDEATASAVAQLPGLLADLFALLQAPSVSPVFLTQAVGLLRNLADRAALHQALARPECLGLLPSLLLQQNEAAAADATDVAYVLLDRAASKLALSLVEPVFSAIVTVLRQRRDSRLLCGALGILRRLAVATAPSVRALMSGNNVIGIVAVLVDYSNGRLRVLRGCISSIEVMLHAGQAPQVARAHLAVQLLAMTRQHDQQIPGALCVLTNLAQIEFRGVFPHLLDAVQSPETSTAVATLTLRALAQLAMDERIAKLLVAGGILSASAVVSWITSSRGSVESLLAALDTLGQLARHEDCRVMIQDPQLWPQVDAQLAQVRVCVDDASVQFMLSWARHYLLLSPRADLAFTSGNLSDGFHFLTLSEVVLDPYHLENPRQIKVSPSYLQVRTDAPHALTVSATTTISADPPDRWYYEVTAESDGTVSCGFTDPLTEVRHLLSVHARAGDVVGVLLNIHEAQLSMQTNAVEADGATLTLPVPCDASSAFIASVVVEPFQQLTLNFGQTPFLLAPDQAVLGYVKARVPRGAPRQAQHGLTASSLSPLPTSHDMPPLLEGDIPPSSLQAPLPDIDSRWSGVRLIASSILPPPAKKARRDERPRLVQEMSQLSVDEDASFLASLVSAAWRMELLGVPPTLVPMMMPLVTDAVRARRKVSADFVAVSRFDDWGGNGLCPNPRIVRSDKSNIQLHVAHTMSAPHRFSARAKVFSVKDGMTYYRDLESVTFLEKPRFDRCGLRVDTVQISVVRNSNVWTTMLRDRRVKANDMRVSILLQVPDGGEVESDSFIISTKHVKSDVDPCLVRLMPQVLYLTGTDMDVVPLSMAVWDSPSDHRVCIRGSLLHLISTLSFPELDLVIGTDSFTCVWHSGYKEHVLMVPVRVLLTSLRRYVRQTDASLLPVVTVLGRTASASGNAPNVVPIPPLRLNVVWCPLSESELPASPASPTLMT